jgi:hypothetical protein
MSRQLVFATIALISCFELPNAYSVERGRSNEGRSEGRQSLGGSWSERSHQGGSGHHNYGQSQSEQGRGSHNEGASESSHRSSESSNPEGAGAASASSRQNATTGSQSHDAAAGAAHSNQPQYSGGQGAAAANRNQSQYSGQQGAVAGAAATNRNEPQHSGAQGAAAGAATANRNQPQYSGKQGAAAGAAVANRNQPQYSGAQGAAAGAAVANRNQPTYSGAQGAAIGAAAANQNAPTFSGTQGAAIGTAAADQNQPPISSGEGAVIGAAAVNQPAPAVSSAQAARIGAAAANQNATAGSVIGRAVDPVAARTSFTNYNLFTRQWNSQNPDAWRVSRWTAGNAWSPTNWPAVSGFYGSTAAPVWYDYGDNVVYRNGNIIMNGRDVGTAEQFSEQAADLADVGAANEPADSTWLPLGVFAMVRNEQQHPHLIMQLAVNRQGMLRGNYTDEVTENTQPIRGAVDQNTQRAAWIVGTHKSLVMEAGLSNLSEGDAPALIHKNGKTDHWLLVRLEQPTRSQKPNDK